MEQIKKEIYGKRIKLNNRIFWPIFHVFDSPGLSPRLSTQEFESRLIQ